MKKKIILLLLALVILFPIIASCSGKTDDAPDNTANSQQSDDSVTEADEPNILDGLNFNGKEFRIQMSDTEISSNGYMQGSEEDSGEIVDHAVYARNMAVEERLGIKITYTKTNYKWDEVTNQMRKFVSAGSDDFELIVNDQLGLSTASLEKLLVNAYDCAYFDFDQPYWWKSYMKDLSITNKEMYLLVGDYFIDVLRKSHVLYYNKNLYSTLFGDPDDLYRTVTSGKWTYDALLGYVKASYSDVNGNSQSDADDQYGMIIAGMWGAVFPFIYSSDAKFIARDADGFPSLSMDNERMTKLYDKVYNVYYNAGTRTEYEDNDDVLHAKFASGTALFMNGAGIGDFDLFRNMPDDIGLVPYPKLDETQKDYVTVIHDTAEVGAIPITCQNKDFASAVIQALCEETYKTVIPAYYETALKIKYVRDDYTAQMIDLVHDGISGLFPLIYGADWANNIFTWTFLEPLRAKNESCVSSYASREVAAVKGLEKLVATYTGN